MTKSGRKTMSAIQSKIEGSISSAEDLNERILFDIRRLNSLSLEERRVLDADIDKNCKKLEDTINSITKDLNKVPQKGEVEFLKGELQQLRTNYKNATDEIGRIRLMAANDPRIRQENQLLNNKQRSDAVRDDLDEAIRTGNSTITTGNAIMATLVDDRKLLDHVDQNLNKITAEGEAGEKTAGAMLMRACCNGIISWVIVVLLVIILIFSLWHRLK